VPGKVIFDIDGTICPIKENGQSYLELVPYQNVINKLKYLKNSGYIIVLYTSRNMRTFEENIGLINKFTAPDVLQWLENYNIPYDEIIFGKPWPQSDGFYVDDRTIRPLELINNTLAEIKLKIAKEQKMLKKMQLKNQIVITMAGLSSRFKKAGYEVPKYMITTNGKTLFEWSMLSLKSFIDSKSSFIFIARSGEGSAKFIKDSCSSLGIDDVSIVEIDELTDGQATTVLFAKKYLVLEHPIGIYNIDTHVKPYVINSLDIEGNGWIPCFEAEGNKWSFVSLDGNRNATSVREKVRISSNATVGFYWFKSAKLYFDTYESYYSDDNNVEMNEKYIAPLYNDLINKGLNVRIKLISELDIVPMGTPDDISNINKGIVWFNK